MASISDWICGVCLKVNKANIVHCRQGCDTVNPTLPDHLNPDDFGRDEVVPITLLQSDLPDLPRGIPSPKHRGQKGKGSPAFDPNSIYEDSNKEHHWNNNSKGAYSDENNTAVSSYDKSWGNFDKGGWKGKNSWEQPMNNNKGHKDWERGKGGHNDKSGKGHKGDWGKNNWYPDDLEILKGKAALAAIKGHAKDSYFGNKSHKGAGPYTKGNAKGERVGKNAGLDLPIGGKKGDKGGDKGKGTKGMPVPPQIIPGDWICPGCGDLQFGRNKKCRQCGCAKPQDEQAKAQNPMAGWDFQRMVMQGDTSPTKGDEAALPEETTNASSKDMSPERRKILLEKALADAADAVRAKSNAVTEDGEPKTLLEERDDKTSEKSTSARNSPKLVPTKSVDNSAADDLDQFLDEGAEKDEMQMSSRNELAEVISEGLNEDSQFSTCFTQFCQNHNTNILDPMRHSESFLREFFAYLAQEENFQNIHKRAWIQEHSDILETMDINLQTGDVRTTPDAIADESTEEFIKGMNANTQETFRGLCPSHQLWLIKENPNIQSFPNPSGALLAKIKKFAKQIEKRRAAPY